jgi:hypothetical protein
VTEGAEEDTSVTTSVALLEASESLDKLDVCSETRRRVRYIILVN